jgi:hypothetical protein
MEMKSKTAALVLVLLTGLNIFLALNRHSRSNPYSYHGELWADRAGYFMYLPAATSFGFDARRFPAGLDTLTGGGFTLDTLTGRVLTKYTSGVALLQAPFYLAGHGAAHVLGIPAGHFGPVDRVIVDVAAPVLLSLGLWCLFLVLRVRHGDGLSAWTLLGIYAGSNLFYYTIGDPGMSHVYSFFLFALLMLDRPGAPYQPCVPAGGALCACGGSPRRHGAFSIPEGQGSRRTARRRSPGVDPSAPLLAVRLWQCHHLAICE